MLASANKEDLADPDDQMAKFMRGQRQGQQQLHVQGQQKGQPSTRQGFAITRSSPPRIKGRTITSTSFRGHREDGAAVTSGQESPAAPAPSPTTTTTTGQKARVRQPIKRRTQRSHTDQLFAQTAPIALDEYDNGLGLSRDLEDLETFEGPASHSLVQALTLSNSLKGRGGAAGGGGAMAAMDVKTKGSKTLTKAKGISKEKGLEKKSKSKSGSRTGSCSQS